MSQQASSTHRDLSQAYRIALFGSALLALVSVGDAYMSNSIFNPISSDTKVAGVMAYLSFGAVIGFLVNLVLTLLFGAKLDKENYKGWKNLTRLPIAARKRALLSGLAGALAQTIVIAAYQNFDPTLVAILTATGVVFVAFYEIKDTKSPTITLQMVKVPLLLVIVGAALSSIKSEKIFTGDFKSWMLAFVSVFIIRNLFNAVNKLVDKKAKKASYEVHDKTLNVTTTIKIDSWTYNTWRFWSLAMCSVFITVVSVIAAGEGKEYLELITPPNLGKALLVMISLMTVVFFAHGKLLDSLRDLESTEQALIESVRLPVSFILVLAVNAMIPDSVGSVSTHPLIMVCRIVGGVIILYGVYRVVFAKSILEKIEEESQT